MELFDRLAGGWEHAPTGGDIAQGLESLGRDAGGRVGIWPSGLVEPVVLLAVGKGLRCLSGLTGTTGDGSASFGGGIHAFEFGRIDAVDAVVVVV
jgi:hypothetical protein